MHNYKAPPVIIALILSLMLTGLATGNDFPNRPLTLLVGFNPGGSVDIQAKALAEALSDQLNQPVELLYQPGAGGAVAAAMLAASQEGAYVFLYGPSLPFTFTPLTTSTSYQWDSVRHIAALAMDQSAIVTGGTQPWQTWADFLAYARTQEEIAVASQSPQDRFLMNLISQKEGINFRVIPTTGGAGMAPLVVSGDVDIAFSGGTHTQFTDAGDMRVLLGLSDERLIYYPSAPTHREMGYQAGMTNLRVITLPLNTAEEDVQVLSKALDAATRDRRFMEATEQVRLPLMFLSENDVMATLRRQTQEFQRLIADFGD
ncbi:tripartite tricarboxylate transporter substrate-binding protein [Salinispirillum marinum]|uniref:Tripartite tricarboxylate transporter substrate-binding protein n=2 Tax=Saccharospirillaceae TaxID=255527 RepID=A0ABV8BGQ5_9GAMM